LTVAAGKPRGPLYGAISVLGVEGLGVVLELPRELAL
jgi:hypothetical protein